MHQHDTQDEPTGKRGKNQLPQVPANADKLKLQLEELADVRQANPSGEPKDVAPQFGGR